VGIPSPQPAGQKPTNDLILQRRIKKPFAGSSAPYKRLYVATLFAL
jgi:hypothetical protein